MNNCNIVMNNFKLNYIPSQTQIQQFYQSFQSQPPTPLYDQQSHSPEQSISQTPITKKLSPAQVNDLVQRLTANNNHNIFKQKIQKILHDNQEWDAMKNMQKRSVHDHQVEERLLMEGKKREERLEEQRKKKEWEETRHLQEKPVITDRYLYNYKPLKNRVGEIISTQRENLKVIEQKLRPTFNPEINKYSAFIAEVKSEGDVINRLHENKKAETNRELLKNQVESKLKQQATFRPKINQNSRRIYQSNRNTSRCGKQNTVTGNKSIPQNRFQPEICKKSEMIVKNSFRERLEDDCQNRKKRELELERIRSQEYSFKPKINRNSKRLASSRRSCRLEQVKSEDTVENGGVSQVGKEEESHEEVEIGEMKRKQWSSLRKVRSIAQGLMPYGTEISQRNQSKLQELFGKKFMIYQ